MLITSLWRLLFGVGDADRDRQQQRPGDPDDPTRTWILDQRDYALFGSPYFWG